MEFKIIYENYINIKRYATTDIPLQEEEKKGR